MASERQAIQRRRRVLHEQLRALSHQPLMRGSLYQRRRRCGRKGCACATNPAAAHPSLFLSVSLDGRTRGFHVRPEDEAQVRGAIAGDEELWKIVNALTGCEVAELRRRVRERRRERTARSGS